MLAVLNDEESNDSKQGPRNSNLMLNAKERNLEKVIWCTVKKGLILVNLKWEGCRNCIW